MPADSLVQILDSRTSILNDAVAGVPANPPDSNREGFRRDIATLYDLLVESPQHVERLYRSLWEHATSGSVDPSEIGRALFASWDNAWEGVRQAQPLIETAERAGDLPRASAGRLANVVLSLKAEREKAHDRWPWLTPADAEAAEAEHARGETIPNKELIGELQRGLATRGAG